MRQPVRFLFACALGLAANAGAEPGFRHLGAEFGDYRHEASGGISLSQREASGKEQTLALGGAWRLALDPGKAGAREGWFSKALPGTNTIALPGTLDEAGIGEPGKPSLSILTRRHEYIGMAWYQREIAIPESWRGKVVRLWLDRVMWESRLYLDGRLAGSEDSLCTPHVYELGELSPGRHVLTLRIDNSARPGANGHGYGDDTQIKWNGVVGRMELTARDKVHVGRVQTIPDMGKKRVIARVTLEDATGKTVEGALVLWARVHGERAVVDETRMWFKIAGPSALVDLVVDLSKDWRPWDEFSPALYDLEAEVTAKDDARSYRDETVTRFGLREIGQRGTQFTMNGRTIFLRGTHDGVGFMKTGHPAGEKADWLRIFRICKSYGLNHVRYHSICPNTPAFLAADEEGVILQVELPAWASIKQEWAGQAFLQREMERILEFYGNSPSFCLFSLGNEHAGDWDFLGRMVERAKRLDPTRKFVAASNEYIRPGDRGAPVNPNDDYAVIMFGAEKNGKRPRIRYMERMSPGNEDFDRAADYRDIVADFKVPVLAHELGQWWSYPDFNEIKKYDGVLRAFDLETFRDDVRKAGLLGQNDVLRIASGQEAVALYKEDIERNLRTPGLAGFQLLDLHDYPGQGVALVGILDSFWDSKGFIAPKAFRDFCAPTVILARLAKNIWTAGETVSVPLEVAHYAAADWPDAKLSWRFETDRDTVLARGETQPRPVKTGSSTFMGDARLVLPENRAAAITLLVEGNNGTRNSWRFWCYPRKPAAEPGAEKVRIATRPDDELLSYVEQGGRALLIADDLPCQVPVYFVNPIWTPQNNIETCGAFIRDSHPALADFPTQSFSDFQWHNFMRPGRAFILNDARAIMPIVQNIEAPSIRRNYLLASMFAVRLGKGALVATSLALPGERPEARQLRQSLLNYLARGNFADANPVTRAELLAVVRPDRFGYAEAPTGRRALEVLPAARAAEDGFKAWEPGADGVKTRAPGFGYRFEKTDRRWGVRAPSDMVVRKGNRLRAWSLNQATLFVTCPKGFSGSVYLHFQDSEKSGKRKGYVFGLGGAVMADREDGEGVWARLKVRPGDSASGEFPLYFRKLAYGDGWSTTPFVTGLVVTAE